MSSHPQLFDRDLIRARRRRAIGSGVETFLHDAAFDEIEERLSQVNRQFTEAVVVTGFDQIWQQGRLKEARIIADEDVLDLTPASANLVVHAMGLHMANDPVGQIIQCRRALKPDGLFLAIMPGGRSLEELRIAFAEAEIALRGGLSPRIAPMADLRDLGGLVQRAGLALPVADAIPLRIAYSDPMRLLRDLKAMGESNALTARDRRPVTRGLLDAVVAAYRKSFTREDGRVDATFELMVLTGWAPAPDQPQPLRPGSATHRLSEALGVPEQPAGDTAEH